MIEVKFTNTNYQKKDGSILKCVMVDITNKKNGAHFDFMDFGLTLPKNYTLTIKKEDIKQDNYGRFLLSSYILNNKYTLAMNILLEEEEEERSK